MPRLRTTTRLLIALIVFALAWAIAQSQYCEWYVGRWVLWLGQRLGYEYEMISGRILTTPDGPFLGGPGWMNYAFGVVPELSVAVLAFSVAATVYWLTGRFRVRPDGNTRCGRCDHILRGLTEPRCPECGQVI